MRQRRPRIPKEDLERESQTCPICGHVNYWAAPATHGDLKHCAHKVLSPRESWDTGGVGAAYLDLHFVKPRPEKLVPALWELEPDLEMLVDGNLLRANGAYFGTAAEREDLDVAMTKFLYDSGLVDVTGDAGDIEGRRWQDLKDRVSWWQG